MPEVEPIGPREYAGPLSKVCGARTRRAFDWLSSCVLAVGHEGRHEGRTDNGMTLMWSSPEREQRDKD
jgi:hypothetical protein